MANLVVHIKESDRDIFQDIVSGRKTIETRAATIKFQKVLKGDQLIVRCGADTVTKEVKRVEHYLSIKAMFEKVDLKKVLPNAATVEEAIKIYYSFPGYKEKIEQNGIQVFYI